MMKNIIILFVVLFAFFQSCMKDKGNYDYSFDKERDLQVDTLDHTALMKLSWNVGTQITYQPKVAYLNGDEKNLTYTWFVVKAPYQKEQIGNTQQFPEPDTICRTKKLDYVVDLVAGKSYHLYLTVRDTVMGISATKMFLRFFYVPLPDDNYSGLMCLYEKDGKLDIDVFQSTRGMIFGSNNDVIRNVYSKNNPLKPLTGKPLLFDYSRTGRWYYLFTENEGLRVAPTGMQIMDTWQQGMFYDPPVYKPQSFMNVNNTDFLINNGKLHVLYATIAGDRKFATPIIENGILFPFLSSETIAEWDVVPGAIDAYQIVYNTTTKSFQPFFNRRTNFGIFNASVNNAPFDVNSMTGDPVYINTVNGGETAAIMKLPNGKYVLNVATFYNVVDKGNLAIHAKPLDGLTDLNKAKVFESGMGGSAIFYAVGNKVYSYSYLSGQTKSKLFWEGESGDEITCMKILPTGGYPTGGRVIWIAVWNEAKKEGKIIDCEFDPYSGELDFLFSEWVGLTENATVTKGFGKITHMLVKSAWE